MPTITITQPAVERLKAPSTGRVEYWDKICPGLGLRVSASGRKTWVVMYRAVRGGRRQLVRETIGTTATLPEVAKARDRARESLQSAAKGTDPIAARREAAKAAKAEVEIEEARQRDTLNSILDRYLAEHGAKRWRPDTLKEVRRSFAFDVRPTLGAEPVQDITRRHVRELLDGIVARGRAPHAHHVLAYLRPALEWAVEREIIAANPAVGVPDPDPRKREARTRDRYLDDDEIRLFWPACETIGWPFGPLFQLLMLTGQRRDEVAQARWSEFDLDKALWTLPRERAKNNKAHLVHLSPLAATIIKGLPTIGAKGLLFTTTGDSPISGFSQAQERVAARMIELRRVELSVAGDGKEPESTTIPHFTIHDLRRSTATGMAGLGIAQHVVEKVLNHTGGKISGVAATYNRFEYLAERQAALELWSRHVEGLVRPASGNVVELRRF
jgi:integrase